MFKAARLLFWAGGKMACAWLSSVVESEMSTDLTPFSSHNKFKAAVDILPRSTFLTSVEESFVEQVYEDVSNFHTSSTNKTSGADTQARQVPFKNNRKQVSIV